MACVFKATGQSRAVMWGSERVQLQTTEFRSTGGLSNGTATWFHNWSASKVSPSYGACPFVCFKEQLCQSKRWMFFACFLGLVSFASLLHPGWSVSPSVLEGNAMHMHKHTYLPVLEKLLWICLLSFLFVFVFVHPLSSFTLSQNLSIWQIIVRSQVCWFGWQ